MPTLSPPAEFPRWISRQSREPKRRATRLYTQHDEAFFWSSVFGCVRYNTSTLPFRPVWEKIGPRVCLRECHFACSTVYVLLHVLLLLITGGWQEAVLGAFLAVILQSRHKRAILQSSHKKGLYYNQVTKKGYTGKLSLWAIYTMNVSSLILILNGYYIHGHSSGVNYLYHTFHPDDLYLFPIHFMI